MRHGIADLNDASISVYREPGPDGYHSVATVRGGERLAPLAFPELALTAREVLGSSVD